MYGTVFVKERKREGDCKPSMKPWSLLYRAEFSSTLNIGDPNDVITSYSMTLIEERR